MLELRRLGYLRIFKLNEARTAGGKRIRKVPGDYSAIEAGTLRAVLVEVKATESDRIIFSRLEKHQVQELNEHTAIGAPGLLVLVFKDSVHVLSWPIQGFKNKDMKLLKSMTTSYELSLRLKELERFFSCP